MCETEHHLDQVFSTRVSELIWEVWIHWEKGTGYSMWLFFFSLWSGLTGKKKNNNNLYTSKPGISSEEKLDRCLWGTQCEEGQGNYRPTIQTEVFSEWQGEPDHMIAWPGQGSHLGLGHVWTGLCYYTVKERNLGLK